MKKCIFCMVLTIMSLSVFATQECNPKEFAPSTWQSNGTVLVIQEDHSWTLTSGLFDNPLIVTGEALVLDNEDEKSHLSLMKIDCNFSEENTTGIDDLEINYEDDKIRGLNLFIAGQTILLKKLKN